jgi:long-chain fatty acid transport protein
MKFRTGSLFCSASMLMMGTAHATNGYFTTGAGTGSDGMAGAGSADPTDVMILATNPAGLAYVGLRTEVGLGLFSPLRSYSTSPSLANGQGGAFTLGPENISSSNKLFPIPYIARNWQLGPDDVLGAAFYARGGMNTTWPGGNATFAPGPGAPVRTFPGTFGTGTTGVNLMQAFLNLSAAHSWADHAFTLGGSAIFAMQRFDARGLGNFVPYTQTFAQSGGAAMPAALSNTGADMSYGGGVAVGLEWQPVAQFSVAAAYTSKMYMSDLNQYSDLFAGHGSFDIPASATVGVTYKPTQPFAISFDVQEIWYGDVGSVGHPFQNLFACPTAGAGGADLQSCLGGSNGPGFGWRDMTVYKLGGRWEVAPDWTVRAGISHGTEPVPSSQVLFNILAPGVIQNHFALGLVHRNASHGELAVDFVYAANKTVKGQNPFDPTQTITLKMHQYMLEISYAWAR